MLREQVDMVGNKVLADGKAVIQQRDKRITTLERANAALEARLWEAHVCNCACGTSPDWFNKVSRRIIKLCPECAALRAGEGKK